MEQKWALVDFGKKNGVDIVETARIEYPKKSRGSLNNSDFNFKEEDELVYTFVKPKLKAKKTGGSAASSGADQPQQITRYTITVLKFGDTKVELKPALDRVVSGKDIDATESPLGRGKRGSIPKARFDDSDSEIDSLDEDDQPLSLNKEKKQKNKAVQETEATEANKLIEEIVRKGSRAMTEETKENMEGVVRELRRENAALREDKKTLQKEVQGLTTALALSEELPALLNQMRTMCREVKPHAHVAQPVQPSTCKPKFSSPSPGPAVLLDEDLKSKTTGEVLLTLKEIRMLPSTSQRALVNSLMERVFGMEVLQTHSLTGGKCNVQKEEPQRPALAADKLAAIRCFARTTFPGYSDSDFNRHAREKMSNARKVGAKK